MKLYLRAVRYFRQDRRYILLLCGLIFVSIGIGLLQVWPMAVLVDEVLAPVPHSTWVHRLFLAPFPRNRLAQVIGITLIGMGLKIAQDTITMLRLMINNRLRCNGLARVRYELFHKFQELGWSFRKTCPQGEAIYRLETDATGMYGILDTVIAAGVAAVMLMGMTGVMISRSVALTACALSITPVLALINLWFGRRIKARAGQAKEADAEFTTSVQESLSAMAVVQAFCRQSEQRRRLAGVIRRSAQSSIRLAWQEALYPLSRDIAFAIGGAVTFGYGGYLVYRDQFVHPVGNGLTVGDLMVVMAYFAQLWDPLSRIAGSGASLQTNAAAAERVFEVLDRQPEVVQAPNASPLPLQPRRLTMQNVVFGYEAEFAVLRGIDAEIAPGETVAFVGASGAGKSTLLLLTNRSVDPWSGSVQLDGVDLRELVLHDVRRHIGVVSQESPLLTATVAQNIALGRPASSEAEIEAAARLAGADEFIQKLPEKYDTLMVEGGRNLSGGQRQRLAIARALLSGAPILLLDEATSAQDSVNERILVNTLRAMKGCRTVILMTHRLQTAAECDRILVLVDGRVHECGSHAELLDLGGVYRAMWHAQFFGEESKLEFDPALQAS